MHEDDENFASACIEAMPRCDLVRLKELLDEPIRVVGLFRAAIERFEKTQYDPVFGDDKKCECGHIYYRHFDPFENMSDVGCKYCSYAECEGFKEAK